MKRIFTLLCCLAVVLIAWAENDPVTSKADLQTGWYRIQCKADNANSAYVGRYVYNGAKEYVQNNQHCYPLFMQVPAAEPAADDATYYIRLERNGNDIYVQSANGHYINFYTAGSTSPVALDFTYSGTGFQIGQYWAFFPSLDNILGKAAGASAYRFAIYPVAPSEAGLEAWQMVFNGKNETNALVYYHTQVACATTGLKGLQKVYNKGFFFLPAGVTPQPSDFTVEGDSPAVSIDEATKTITLTFESNAIDVAEVKQGYQTAGRGNERQLLLRIDLQRNVTGAKLTGLGIRLDEETRRNIGTLSLWQTTGTEFYANTKPTSLSTIEPTANELTLPLDYTMKSGINHLWLTASVNADATLGEAIDAALMSITFTADGEEKTVDVAASLGNPNGVAHIFATQSFAYVPTTDNCQFYRIPAMMLDQQGNIVVAADRRYNSNSDLGNHKIDVSIRRSEDGGHTWSAQNIIATGDGKNTATYGYGDPALARTQSGRLICVMAAGSVMYWNGMRNAAICISDDNGLTWTKPRQLYTRNFTDAVNGKKNSLGFYGNFISSGKGLTTKDGTVMFTNNCLTYDDKSTPQCYIIYSTDNGDSWTLGPGNAYRGADESKLEQMNNGDLLVSVRQSGARGFNTGSADASAWDSQWRNSQISGNACNADILYYSRSTEGQRDIMLHSYINSGSRENLTLAMSIDQGASWQNFMNIQPGGSCYSTMVRMPDGSVALLYEDESYSAGNGYAINFLTITEEQINAFADQLKADTDEDYQRALDELENGGVYYFATNYLNDEPVRGIYYLKADGTLTTDGQQAKYFTLQKRAIGGGYKPIGWKSGQFTNPTNATTNTKYIRTSSQNRDNWEAQVITRNADGFYAIRATNAATEETWGSNAYWTTDAEGNATYDLKGGAHYIWRIVKVGTTPRFESGQTYKIITGYEDNGYTLEANGRLELVGDIEKSHNFTIESASEGFIITDKETGKQVARPNSSGLWTLSATAAQCRIQKVNFDGEEFYMIQAPFADKYANAAIEWNATGMNATEATGIVSSETRNTENTFWKILPSDIALDISLPTDKDWGGTFSLPTGDGRGSARFFAPNGQRLQQPQQGLNIVRRPDGSVLKVLKR